VPEVGLELHSRRYEHWVPTKTCRIRGISKTVRADPEARVWTMSTLLLLARDALLRLTESSLSALVARFPEWPMMRRLGV